MTGSYVSDAQYRRKALFIGFSAQAITGLQDYSQNMALSLRRARFSHFYDYIKISIYINKYVYKYLYK